ncbi:hypothetical protein MAPG_08742 [Magnaporthiopsis poae ATCC 64411]|uniref:Uncharacterized protein n=1 Tax=Magnaporthiopsis poae (strain ATCC 64411 / 73-15) TaxID=644358 RepID=A0A0C4E854_MAGP6|nr:hypothetical protein MAPG_08742 [Magnaporthiopsis poae ATCC 64411]
MPGGNIVQASKTIGKVASKQGLVVVGYASQYGNKKNAFKRPFLPAQAGQSFMAAVQVAIGKGVITKGAKAVALIMPEHASQEDPRTHFAVLELKISKALESLHESEFLQGTVRHILPVKK